MSAREKIINFLENEVKKPLSFEELCVEFEINERSQRKDFHNLLDGLIQEGIIYQSNKGKYGIPEKFNLIKGIIERNPKGFAFLIPDDPTREDIYISMENIDGAMHNDKVLVRISSTNSGNREEGEVIKVIERANDKVVGNLEVRHNFGFVVPDNKRIFADVFVPQDELNGARDGQKVVVKIETWPQKNRSPEGEIVEILGDKEESGVNIEAIIRQYDLPSDFPEPVKKEVDKISLDISDREINNRRDLRGTPMITIDGEDAKDFDDAVSIKKLADKKVRLGVHIADVTHYVKKGSPLDEEALNRGTSIYLVDRVIPMLPEKLSNGICSLKPRKNRLTVSVLMDFELEPLKLTNYEIFPSIIKTNYRMTYNEVREILVENNQEVINEYQDFVSELKLMNRLREKLRTKRFNEGSLDFDFPEVNVILNDKGQPVDLEPEIHGIPEQLIEEFMIKANQVIAEDMYWKEIPFIYRVHDEPDFDSIKSFNEFIHNFGYFIKGIKNGVHPHSLQNILEEVSGEPEERVISTVLLRSMKKAVYSEENIGHFGLALDYYTHFTSPIRRYPDLMIHRIIKEVIAQGYLNQTRCEELNKRLPQIAEHSSFQERKAMEAERESVDFKKLQYMQDKIGKKYEGIISGVTNFGFFVELENMVEGLVHVENLTDDYYYYIKDQHALVGERMKKMYKLGDKVEIIVDQVNLNERQLDFVLAD